MTRISHLRPHRLSQSLLDRWFYYLPFLLAHGDISFVFSPSFVSLHPGKQRESIVVPLCSAALSAGKRSLAPAILKTKFSYTRAPCSLAQHGLTNLAPATVPRGQAAIGQLGETTVAILITDSTLVTISSPYELSGNDLKTTLKSLKTTN